MSHKKITATISLPHMLITELAQYARRKEIAKNEVIEIAVKKFLEEEIKNELMESFKRIAEDADIIEMAEWGIGDYLEQLKEMEK